MNLSTFLIGYALLSLPATASWYGSRIRRLARRAAVRFELLKAKIFGKLRDGLNQFLSPDGSREESESTDLVYRQHP
ncbi:hypothetical protein [Streptomyces sp. NPDC004324]